MKKTHKFFLFIIALWSMASVGIAQSNDIKIKYIGNCGLHLTDGTTHIYVDFPYKSGAYGYMKYNEQELDSVNANSIFIFTHRHADHYSKKRVRRLKKVGDKKVYGSWNAKKMKSLSTTINDFSIVVYKTKHRFTFKHYSYAITWHGKKIFLSGDTEYAETIASEKNIDIAFVPYWILLDATRKELKIDTKKFAVYHLYPNQKVNNSSPERVRLMDKQGEVLILTQ